MALRVELVEPALRSRAAPWGRARMAFGLTARGRAGPAGEREAVCVRGGNPPRVGGR